MKKVFEKLQGINGIVLSIYLAVIGVFSMYFSVAGISGMSTAVKLLLTLIAGAVALTAGPFLVKKIRPFRLPGADEDYLHSKKRFYFAAGVWIAAFLVFLPNYIAYYPGAIINDAATQFGQAVSGQYWNEHPLIHTFLSFTVPLKLTGGWAGSIALIQMLLFCSVICYIYVVLARLVNYKLALGVAAFLILNPITGKMSIHPLKDSPMALCAAVLVLCALQIYYSRGEWLRSPRHIFLLAFSFSMATMVRHNGILFTLPVAVGIVLSTKDWKSILKTAGIIVVMFLAVRVGLYQVLNSESADNWNLQTLGLPLTIIGNVVVESPDSLDEETREFVYAFAPQETWEKYYVCGNFNNLRRSGEVDLELVEEYGRGAIIKMAISCIEREPVLSFKAFLYLTKVVYLLDPGDAFYEITWEVEEYQAVPYQGSLQMKAVVDGYSHVFYNTPLKYIFCYIGVMNVLVIICICGKIRLNVFEDWKRLFSCVAILTYNFATMLMLTGSDDRFFYLSFFTAPLLAIFALKGEASLPAAGAEENA
ncbi:MAG: hypothetical protein LIO67_06770 [Lachnospiraceae bacterium]|nr:hypothetical protein [Lachnospiraceae bacterium]